MIKKTITIFTFLLTLPIAAKNHIQIADSEIKRNPESWMLDFRKTLKWDYCHGLELLAFWKVYEKTGNVIYFEYIKSYFDTIIDSKGSISTYNLSNYNIDHVTPGKVLMNLYKKTGNQKYLTAIQTLRNQMKSHPRTSEGGFWHKKVYPHQMWLDGLYMASPFLTQYAVEFKEPELFEEVTKQLILMAKYSYDSTTGLYYHGWDESREQRWSNPKTGTSPNFWSRSMGWYMMALVDVLEFLPHEHPKRSELISILQGLTDTLLKYRDSKTGMWYQVTNLPERKGNYLESSGSAMYIYSIVKGAKAGYLKKEYLKIGKKLYQQFVKTFVQENEDGTMSVTNCCAVAGLGGDNRYRDGSFEYYISEPVRNNDAKTVGPFMMVSILLNK